MRDCYARWETEYLDAEEESPAISPPEKPTIEQLMAWESEGGCEATDGCWVEPDGTCEHGCKSWLAELGLI